MKKKTYPRVRIDRAAFCGPFSSYMAVIAPLQVSSLPKTVFEAAAGTLPMKFRKITKMMFAVSPGRYFIMWEKYHLNVLIKIFFLRVIEIFTIPSGLMKELAVLGFFNVH